MQFIKPVLLSTCALISASFFTPSISYADMNSHSATTQKQADKEASILGFMIALNEHEIKVSEMALDKNVSPAVAEFANMMKQQHTENLDAMKDMAKKLDVTPADNKEINAFKDKGEKAEDKLDKLSGEQFQIAYMDAMVKGHENALKMVNKFIKEAQQPQLKALLEQTKTVVQTHLQHAKTVRASLKK